MKVIYPKNSNTNKFTDPYFLFSFPNDEEEKAIKAGVIFLAGPCPRKDYETDWRNEAIKYLKDAGFEGIVFNPTDSLFDTTNPLELEKQTDWELKAMQLAINNGKVVFWIPRTKEDPAFTTNIELGGFLNKDNINQIMIGMPDYGIKNDYIKIRLKMLDTYYDTDLKTLMYRVAEYFDKNK